MTFLNEYRDSRMDQIDTAAIREELRRGLQSVELGNRRNIAVFGAGDSAERWLAGRDLQDMEAVGAVEYFIDDTPSKRGTYKDTITKDWTIV
ncbi:MAG: hypothetical protein HFF45_03760 [Lawsonibacter sp.]|jgi:hypothetical protein|nr:hypothetical protein [Lawsonibacter sp.]